MQPGVGVGAGSLDTGPVNVENAPARRTAHRVMAKKKRKVSRSAQGKQRQERRDGWATSRRQVRVS
ncbi:hypothetical protein HaLaN_32726, partial [Haematococcus lacustris]